MKYIASNEKTGLYFSRHPRYASFLAMRENAETLTWNEANALKYLFENVKIEALVKPKPQPQTLGVKLTHKYHSGYNHLNKWHRMGTFTPTGRGIVFRDDGDSYRRKLRVIVKTDGEYRTENIIRALLDSVEEGCTCEHDCCGCYRKYGQSARHLEGDKYEVVISAVANI